jgi:hypothetical protein
LLKRSIKKVISAELTSLMEHITAIISAHQVLWSGSSAAMDFTKLEELAQSAAQMCMLVTMESKVSSLAAV